MSDSRPQPYLHAREDAPAYWNGRILWIMHATAETTAGRQTLMEQLMPQGPAVGPHYHREQDETFYVLDGEIAFTVAGQEHVAGPGAYTFIPKGTVHAFEVRSETARVLNGYEPAGFERLIIEAGVPAERLTLPPEDLPPPDPERLKALEAEVGMVSL